MTGRVSSSPIMCCSMGHADVPAYYVGTYEDDREYPDTPYCKPCGDSVIRTGEYGVTSIIAGRTTSSHERTVR